MVLNGNKLPYLYHKHNGMTNTNIYYCHMLFAVHRRAYLKGLPFGSSKEYCKYLYRCAGEIIPSEVGKNV
jgi:hypothetical protein